MRTLSRTINVGVIAVQSKVVQLVTPKNNDSKGVLAICIVGTVGLALISFYAKPKVLHICVVSLFTVFTLLTLKNMRWGLNFFLLFIPIHLLLLRGLEDHLSTDGLVMFSSVKDFLLLILFYCFLLGLLIKRIRVPTGLINVLVVFFIALNLIFAVYSRDLTTAFYSVRLQLEFVVFYFLIVGLLKTAEHVRNAILSFLAGGVLVAIYASSVLVRSPIAYGYEFGWLPQHIVGRLTVFGGTETSGFFSTYLSIVMLLLCGFAFFIRTCVSRKLYLLILTLLLISFVDVIFSFSRRAWIASFIAILFISLLAKRFKLVVSMLSLLSVIVFASYISSPKATGILYDRLLSISDLHSYYNIARIEEWRDLLIRAKNRYFLGEGLGTVGSVGSKFDIADLTNTHNYYLAVLVQTGAFGLLLFSSIAIASLWFMINAFFAAQTPLLKAVTAGSIMAFIGLLVQNVFGLTVEVYPFNLYYWFFVGLSVSLFAIAKKNTVRHP